MPLQDQLDQYKQGFEAKAPAAALEVMHRATRELAESGILSHTIKVGDMAPDFVLPYTQKKDVYLGGLLDRGPLVLAFYRGRW
jgi:hypothetical protein